MVICVAENINIMSKTIGPAMKERNAGPIQDMARALTKNGADYLDLNIGPARKGGDELLDWLVKTVQEVTEKKGFQ
jgi:cobalamin-dependent methionine synthase I